MVVNLHLELAKLSEEHKRNVFLGCLSMIECFNLMMNLAMHGRRHQIWMCRKCIRNAIIMLKYRNSYAIAANSFGNSKFVIKFAHNKNLKYKLRICQVYKSEALVDNKDLCVIQIPNMPWKFAVPTYLLSKSKFGNELAVFTNLFAYFNIMNALGMHLCGLQIWRCLPWGEVERDSHWSWGVWWRGN